MLHMDPCNRNACLHAAIDGILFSNSSYVRSGAYAMSILWRWVYSVSNQPRWWRVSNPEPETMRLWKFIFHDVAVELGTLHLCYMLQIWRLNLTDNSESCCLGFSFRLCLLKERAHYDIMPLQK